MDSNNEVENGEGLVGGFVKGKVKSLIPGYSLYTKLRNLFAIAFFFLCLSMWPVWLLVWLLALVPQSASDSFRNLFDIFSLIILILSIFFHLRHFKRAPYYALLVTYIGVAFFIWAGLTFEYSEEYSGGVTRFLFSCLFVITGLWGGSIGLNYLFPHANENKIFPFKYFISRGTGKLTNSYSAERLLAKESILFPLFISLILSFVFHILFVVMDIFPNFSS